MTTTTLTPFEEIKALAFDTIDHLYPLWFDVCQKGSVNEAEFFARLNQSHPDSQWEAAIELYVEMLIHSGIEAEIAAAAHN